MANKKELDDQLYQNLKNSYCNVIYYCITTESPWACHNELNKYYTNLDKAMTEAISDCDKNLLQRIQPFNKAPYPFIKK